MAIALPSLQGVRRLILDSVMVILSIGSHYAVTFLYYIKNALFNMNPYKLVLTIATIAAATLAITGGFAASALAASDKAIEHAQTQGKGVCNADQKIHEHALNTADQQFHKGVGKNFGGVNEFVGPGSRCQNPIP